MVENYYLGRNFHQTSAKNKKDAFVNYRMSTD